MMRRFSLLILIASFILAPLALAQDDNPQAEITSPPPVSVVTGVVDVEGTANVPNQSVYFVQFRELDNDLTPIGGEDALWSPATPLRRDAVMDGLLGQWDTTVVDDGIYQLQLVVNTPGGEPVRDTVAAVRVLNTDDPAFEDARVFGEIVATATGDDTDAPAIATAGPTATRSLLDPTPTALVRPTSTVSATEPAGGTSTTDTGVSVTATVQANVRLGDSTSYPAVGFLDVGQAAPVLAQSNRSSWLLIRLSDGTEGFISPSVVNVNGDVFDVPQVEPPPLPFTPTPVPTATFTPPPVAANLVIIDIDISPNNPACGSTFTIEATIENVGSGPTNRSGIANVVDRELDNNDITETTVGGFPVLAPGQRFEMEIPITVDEEENDEHRIEILLDPANEIPETNEGDNFATEEYDLAGSDDCDD